jgi:hypothetical protein
VVAVPGFLGDLRTALKDRLFRPLPVRERVIPEPGGVPLSRLTEEYRKRLIEEIVACGQAISHELGYRPGYTQ